MSANAAANLTTAVLANILERPAKPWLTDLLLRAADVAELTTTERLAHFIGQTAHESAKYARLEESFAYQPGRAASIFLGRNGLTSQQLRNLAAAGPEALANAVYGGPWGAHNLGNDRAGDGWRYRGRGWIQLTGRASYRNFSAWAALHFKNTPNFVEQPDLLTKRHFAALSAAWFWLDKGLNDLADQGDLEAVTRRINGGTNGIEDRRYLTVRATRLLAQRQEVRGESGAHGAPYDGEGDVPRRGRVATAKVYWPDIVSPKVLHDAVYNFDETGTLHVRTARPGEFADDAD